MGKIVLEIEEFAKTHSDYKSFDQDCIRVGRAFDNDVIIKDPFVGASHMSLHCVNGAWTCQNIQSVNGTWVSNPNKGKPRIRVDQAYPLHSGDTIFLGKTAIHVWELNHAIAPEQSLDSRAVFAFDPRKTMQHGVWSGIIFCCMYYLYLSQWSWKNDPSSIQTIIGVCSVLLCCVIWSAIWAVITRFSKRQHRFMQHVIFSLQWAVILLSLSVVLNYLFFFICNPGVEIVLSLMVFGIFNIFVLNMHLAIGTHFSSKKMTMISSAIVVSITLFLVAGYLANHNEFNPNPQHYINLVPVSKKLIPAIPISEEMHCLDAMFR